MILIQEHNLTKSQYLIFSQFTILKHKSLIQTINRAKTQNVFYKALLHFIRYTNLPFPTIPNNAIPNHPMCNHFISLHFRNLMATKNYNLLNSPFYDKYGSLNMRNLVHLTLVSRTKSAKIYLLIANHKQSSISIIFPNPIN